MSRDARSAVGRIASWVGDRGRHPLGRHPLSGVVFGVGVGATALAAKAPLVASAGGDLGYVLYVAAIGIAAWLTGFSGGVAATIVTGFGNTLLYVAPAGEFSLIALSEQVRFVVYIVSGIVVAALFRVLRVERDVLAEALREQARLATAIADRDERLELVLAASRTGVWEFDYPTRAHTWSDQVYVQTQRTRIEGATGLDTLMEPTAAVAVRDAIAAAVAERRPFELDARLALPAERWVHLRGRAFYEGDRPVRLLGTSEDITERVIVERRRAELTAQEERALEFQRAFVDVLSHELRTPMTTIFGAAEVLRRPNSSLDDATRAGLLEDIHEETRRLDGLIENLLVLSRSERAPIEAAAEPVEIERSIELAVAAESARWPDVRFVVACPEPTPVALGSDGYVARVLANLLSNAGKYSRPGGTVRIVVETQPDEVTVRVLDEGVGIDVDPELLFDLFYRAPSATRHAAGSGIGLFVCARLIEAMGGRIWGRSRPEGGAEFGFSLRRVDTTDADGALDAASRAARAS